MPAYLVNPQDGSTTELPDDAHVVMAMQPFVSTGGPVARQMNKYLFWIWMTILVLLGGALFMFAILAFLSTGRTAAFMAPASAALGFIGGVLVPSPTTAGKSDS